MALLKIAKMGHPVLMSPAELVSDPTAPEIAVLVRDMVETMADAGGIGLAAPQVHVGRRVVVYSVPQERTADGNGVDLWVLVNSVIEPLGVETSVAPEGCLSLPGMAGLVKRPDTIRLRYQDLHGCSQTERLTGYHARVVQHECDHLDGILYPMRMDDLGTLGYIDEMRGTDGTGSEDRTRTAGKAEDNHA